MCVAVPGVVTAVGSATGPSIPGRVRIGERETEVDLILVPRAREGDFVVVHSGYALEVVPWERAHETLELLGLDPQE